MRNSNLFISISNYACERDQMSNWILDKSVYITIAQHEKTYEALTSSITYKSIQGLLILLRIIYIYTFKLYKYFIITNVWRLHFSMTVKKAYPL